MTETARNGPERPAAAWARLDFGTVLELLREYAVLVLFAAVFIWLTFASPAFLTTGNLLNILNQNAPLAIVAAAGTLVIISGGFDLSTGAIFGVAAVVSAWLAVNVDPILGLASAPVVGAALGLLNGAVITAFRVHSFLATLATSLVYRGSALLIAGGFLIPVGHLASFTVLGRGRIGDINIAVFVLAAWVVVLWVVLNRSQLGRFIFAVGGNEEAALLSGVSVARIKIVAFVLSGIASGIAGAITVSRIASGQPQAGEGVELQAIAAIILGGTSIYGGAGAIWRSIAGVYLLALIANGFNILNANPFLKDLTTGVIIIIAVALSAARRLR
jgi:ribose transport system permease protein